MVFVKQYVVVGDEGLPLLVVELRRSISLAPLRVVHLDTLALNHDGACVDALDFYQGLL